MKVLKIATSKLCLNKVSLSLNVGWAPLVQQVPPTFNFTVEGFYTEIFFFKQSRRGYKLISHTKDRVSDILTKSHFLIDTEFRALTSTRHLVGF